MPLRERDPSHFRERRSSIDDKSRFFIFGTCKRIAGPPV
jgi:hypothetical protein